MKEDTGSRPRWLTWLHRVGYVTTALVLAELLMLGLLFTRGWLQDRQLRAALIEDSRTHESPLLPNDDFVRQAAIDLFKRLPPLDALHGDGLRFVAMPSFGTNHYAIAIYLPEQAANEAKGILIAVDQRGATRKREFKMPAAAYRSLVARMDKLTDKWPGHDALCLDGSPTAFERVRGRRITSGIGNCDDHYEQLELLMFAHVRQFAPDDDLPTENDGRRVEEDVRSVQK